MRGRRKSINLSITDNAELIDEIRKLLEYNWKDEERDYQETYDIDLTELGIRKDYQEIIYRAQQDNTEDHIYITILKLWIHYGFDEE